MALGTQAPMHLHRKVITSQNLNLSVHLDLVATRHFIKTQFMEVN